MAMEGLSENILYKGCIITFLGFSGGSDGKEAACNVGDLGLIPGCQRSPEGGHGNPLQVFLPGGSPWTEVPGGLQSMGSQRVGYECMTKHSTHKHFIFFRLFW